MSDALSAFDCTSRECPDLTWVGLELEGEKHDSNTRDRHDAIIAREIV